MRQILQRKQHGGWVFGLLLMLYLTGLVFAQEPTPTAAPATLLPTDVATVTMMPTEEPVMIIESSVTPVPLEPSVSPTLEPTVIPTLEATLIVEPVKEEATLAATDMPPIYSLPTTTIQPTMALFPAIDLIQNAVRLPQKSRVTVSVMVRDLTEVYGVALACHVDPARLMGVQSTPGDLLQTDQSVVVDGGFQADGQWVLIERQLDEASGLGSTGLLWELNYQVIGVGLTQLLCQIQLFDRSGQPYGLPVADLAVMVEGYAETVAIVTLTPPTFTATETMSPLLEATVTIVPTLLPVQPIRIEPTFVSTALPIYTDVDGNGKVEDVDAILVIANFGLSVPPAPSSADVNQDGIINIYDLTLISVKLGSSN